VTRSAYNLHEWQKLFLTNLYFFIICVHVMSFLQIKVGLLVRIEVIITF
jgi:hypothetical protein